MWVLGCLDRIVGLNRELKLLTIARFASQVILLENWVDSCPEQDLPEE